MEYKGASAYENDSFFESYLSRRNRKESPNNSIEKLKGLYNKESGI